MLLLSGIFCVTDAVPFVFTDGNAASGNTQGYTDLRDWEKLPWEILLEEDRPFYYPGSDEIRKRNTEFLIFPCVENRYFSRLIAYDQNGFDKLTDVIKGCNLNLDIHIDNNAEFFFKQ